MNSRAYIWHHHHMNRIFIWDNNNNIWEDKGYDADSVMHRPMHVGDYQYFNWAGGTYAEDCGVYECVTRFIHSKNSVWYYLLQRSSDAQNVELYSGIASVAHAPFREQFLETITPHSP